MSAAQPNPTIQPGSRLAKVQALLLQALARAPRQDTAIDKRGRRAPPRTPRTGSTGAGSES
jgi:hypothetical protein